MFPIAKYYICIYIKIPRLAKMAPSLDKQAAEDMKAERYAQAIYKYSQLIEKVPEQSVRWARLQWSQNINISLITRT